MKKFALLIVVICVVGTFLCVFQPADHDNPYLIRRVNMIHQLGFTVSDYVRTHPDSNLKHSSLEDLLAMNVFTSEEIRYLRDNHIAFHGYDPDIVNGTTPLLDGFYTHWNGRKQHIVCFSDGSVVTSQITTN